MEFEEYIEEKLKNEPLFRKAFVHKSYKNIHPHYITNETLETIGDKVLDLVLYEHLYNTSEGNMSKKDMDDMRKEKNSKKGLSVIYDLYNLRKYSNIHEKKQELNNKVKHNFLESLVGAIFLLEGYDKTKKLLMGYIFYPGMH